MRLVECYIENFGVLSGVSYKFTDGINAFLLDNGEGKTTFTVFLKSMLYGIGDTRAHSLDDNDRKKYMPWQGGKFGGSLTFLYNGVLMRVEREFGKRASEDTVRVLNATTGEELSEYNDRLGETIFGIDRAGFMETVFLSEKNLMVGEGKTSTVAQKLSDVVGAEGASDTYDKAQSLLEKAARELRNKRGGAGLIADFGDKIFAADETLRKINEEIKEAKVAEHEIYIIETRLERLATTRAWLTDCLEKERERDTRRGILLQYGDMKKRLEELSFEYGEKLKFFGEGGVNREELSEMMREESEARELGDKVRRSTNEEYGKLMQYFSRPTDWSELAAIEARLAERERLEADRERILGFISLSESSMNTEFGGKIPTDEELDGAILALGKKKSLALPIALTVIGGLLTVGGLTLALLLNPLFYIGFGIGAILTILSVAMLLKPDGNTELLAFMARVGAKNADELSALKTRLADYHREMASKSAELERLSAEARAVEDECLLFLNCYPTEDGAPEARLTEVRTRYGEYYDMKHRMDLESEEFSRASQRLAYLDERRRSYLSRYLGLSDNPLPEIGERMTEVERLKERVKICEVECERFRTANGIGDDEEASLPSSSKVDEYRGLIEMADKDIAALREALAITRGKLTELEEDISKESDVMSYREMCIKEKADLERRFDIINKTRELLDLATKNMTERYIGKTRERLRYYMDIIGETEGELTVDENFTLRHVLRGATHDFECYSRGTRDLYQLALRLALVDSLYPDEAPPIILDDPFIAFDKTHLDGAKEALRRIGAERQIIYFTCSQERAL